jgi:RNA polymerase sigma-70 factor (ECF subfamily)
MPVHTSGPGGVSSYVVPRIAKLLSDADRTRGVDVSAGPAPVLDDAQLLAALRAGDSGAATALHDRARDIVERTVRKHLRSYDNDREDLCQLAFIELVGSIEEFRGDCPLNAWIRIVTAAVVYRHVRRRTFERRLFTTPLELAPERSAMQPSSVLRELVQRVHGHLSCLNENRAYAFLLHDAFGYDLREVAQITGVSVSAAQTRLVRGRYELHELIAQDPELAHALDDLGVTVHP